MIRSILPMLVVFFSIPSFARVLIEPFIGYSTGTLTQTDTSNIDLSGKTNMVDLRLRLALQSQRGYWLGLTYHHGLNGTFVYNDSANGTNSKTTRGDLGLELGHDFANRLRIHIGLNSSTTYGMTDDSPGSQENRFSGGSNYRLGVGYRVHAHGALTLEQFVNSPVNYTNSSGTFEVASTNNKFSEAGFRFFLSFPFFF